MELAAKRDGETDDYVHHRRTEPSTPSPDVAAVALDGGRLLTRESGQGPGVHGEQWKEDKVACLLSLKGQTVAEDPHPLPPRCFLDAPEVDKRCCPHLKPTNTSYRVDETYIKVRGIDRYLYRAVDSTGQTIDSLLTAKRDAAGAKRFYARHCYHWAILSHAS